MSHVFETPATGKDHPSARQRLPALIWKNYISSMERRPARPNRPLLATPRDSEPPGHGAHPGQCAALLKITQEIPVSLQACHGVSAGNQAAAPGILLRL